MKLRLGPLPNPEVVKMTLTIPVCLKEHLEKYMHVHQEVHGQHNAEIGVFISHILVHFLAHDRAFQKSLRADSAVQRSARSPRDPGRQPTAPLRDSTPRS